MNLTARSVFLMLVMFIIFCLGIIACKYYKVFVRVHNSTNENFIITTDSGEHVLRSQSHVQFKYPHKTRRLVFRGETLSRTFELPCVNLSSAGPYRYQETLSPGWNYSNHLFKLQLATDGMIYCVEAQTPEACLQPQRRPFPLNPISTETEDRRGEAVGNESSNVTGPFTQTEIPLWSAIRPL